MRPRILLVLVALVAAFTLCAGGSAAAATGTAAPKPLVLHPHFRLFGTANSPVGITSGPLAVSGRYVLFTNGGLLPLTLFDEETGKRAVIDNAGCSYLAFGPPSILFQCPGATPNDAGFWVYSITTHRRTHVHCTDAACFPLPFDGLKASVGARWFFLISFTYGSCGDGEHTSCGPPSHTFVNIRTGRVRHFYNQLSSTRIIDLNAPYATRVVCKPVTVVPLSASLGPDSTFNDPLFFGNFAATYTVTAGPVNPMTITTYLERCGSNLHMPIDPPIATGIRAPIAANARAVIWQARDANASWHGQLDGVLLPSLRRFTFSLPSNISIANNGSSEIAVSSRRLYVTDARNRIWGAPFPPAPPAPPPQNMKH